MLTVIENDSEGTIRVHGSECRDVAKDARGAHVYVTRVGDRAEALQTVADNQDAEVEEVEGFVTFLPCCGH
ncbi:hypothetical protein [Amycolatopsis orientalis]|uniref:hypothetical protein n=1 Tax=Amycolatopsis orientalis TaxID=31958 RepID=UPI0003A6F352|nr:hypothetical protein [Amycolatopsis orientalis]